MQNPTSAARVGSETRCTASKESKESGSAPVIARPTAPNHAGAPCPLAQSFQKCSSEDTSSRRPASASVTTMAPASMMDERTPT